MGTLYVQLFSSCVRQGGILSLRLFVVYVDDISTYQKMQDHDVLFNTNALTIWSMQTIFVFLTI